MRKNKGENNENLVIMSGGNLPSGIDKQFLFVYNIACGILL